MNELEEIIKIIKNFINDKKQAQQEIAKVESQRTLLAYERNQKKKDCAYEINDEIRELTNNIAQLGNLSQELQNKIDNKFLQVKDEVNNRIGNLLKEKEKELNDVLQEKQKIQEEVSKQEERVSKYKVQTQELFAKFGIIPKLSEDAQKAEENIQEHYNANKQKILELKEKEEKIKAKIEEIETYKKEFKNGNWSKFIVEEEPVENKEETVENVIQKIEEIENIGESFIAVEEIKVEDVQLEDIQIEEAKPILEIEIEEAQELGEIAIEENEKIEENIIEEKTIEETKTSTEIEELEIPNEINVIEETENKADEKFEKVQDAEEDINVRVEHIRELLDNIRKKASLNKAETQEKVETIQNLQPEVKEEVQPVKKVEEIKEISKEEPIEKEIITLEEKEEVDTTSVFNRKISMINITAKFEENDVVYIAQVSDGSSIKIYPFKKEAYKTKERRNNIKEILINYAISEYKHLDKKVINKVDFIICDLLAEFAEQYGYNADELIYTYAMTYSKSEEVDSSEIPTITYNFPTMNNALLTKKEKQTLSKICKNARNNEKIEIIEKITGIKKIKYILRRIFNVNTVDALPEGKY